MKRNIEKVINESLQQMLNEAIVLKGETNNIQSAIDTLEGIHYRVLHQGLSSHEVTINKIGKMITDLKRIKKYWTNVQVW